MAIVPYPMPQRLQEPLDPVLSRFPPDNPVASVRFSPEMGKSKEIKRIIPFCRAYFATRLSKLDQPRLLGMNGKLKAGESLWQNIHKFASICFLFKTNDKIAIKYENGEEQIIDVNKDKMTDIMKKFQDSSAWNLPVVENGKYIGFISKSKLLTAYRRQLINFTK